MEEGSHSASSPLSWSELKTNSETQITSFPLNSDTSLLREIHIHHTRLPTQKNGKLSAEGDRRLLALLLAMQKGVDDPKNIEFSLGERKYTAQCAFGDDGRVRHIKIKDAQDLSRYLWINMTSRECECRGDSVYFPDGPAAPVRDRAKARRLTVMIPRSDVEIRRAAEKQALSFLQCKCDKNELQMLADALTKDVISFQSMEGENFHVLAELLEHIDRSDRSGLSEQRNEAMPTNKESLEFLARYFPEPDPFAGHCGLLSQAPFEFVLGILSTSSREVQITFVQNFVIPRNDVQEWAKKRPGLNRPRLNKLRTLLTRLHGINPEIEHSSREEKGVILEELEKSPADNKTEQTLLNGIWTSEWRKAQAANNELLEKILTQIDARNTTYESILLYFNLFSFAHDSGEKARIAKAVFDRQEELFEVINRAAEGNVDLIEICASFLAFASMNFYYLVSDAKENGILESRSENESEPKALRKICDCIEGCKKAVENFNRKYPLDKENGRDLIEALFHESILIALKLFQEKPKAKLKEGESEQTQAKIDAWASEQHQVLLENYLPSLFSNIPFMDRQT